MSDATLYAVKLGGAYLGRSKDRVASIAEALLWETHKDAAKHARAIRSIARVKYHADVVCLYVDESDAPIGDPCPRSGESPYDCRCNGCWSWGPGY